MKMKPPSLRLTRHFAILGAIILFAAGGLMTVVDQRTSDADISKWAEANNASLTQAIANSVWPRYSEHLSNGRGISGQQLQRSPVTKELFEEIRTLVADLGVLKVKLYASGGVTVFSTQASQIGADYSKNARFLKSLNGGYASKLEFRKKFGAISGPLTERWVLSSYIPVRRGKEGQIMGVAEIYKDVTAQRLDASHSRIIRASIIGLALALVFAFLVFVVWRSDLRLAEYHRRELDLVANATDAEAKSQAKTRFLSNMSHEMRTPLNGVLGMANLLKKSNLDDSQSRLLETIQLSGEELLVLVDDVLMFSKSEAGNLTLDLSQFKIAVTINEIIENFSAAAQKKNIRFSHDVSINERNVVQGDPKRVGQILGYLIDNAIKFTDEGDVSVLVKNVKETDASERVRFEVCDTGIGVPADQQALIFDSFFQAESSADRRFGGAGLGLSLTRQLVDLMDGDMGFESTEGKGSTFWIELEFEIMQEQSSGGSSGPPPDGHSVPIGSSEAVILLAEDNQVNREVVIGNLRGLGLEVDFVETGAEAVQAWERGNYSLILMDIQMPGMDGLEATRQIRSKESQKDGDPVRIVAVTANAFESDRVDCFAAGMDDYMSKPFSCEEFVALIDRWLPKEESDSEFSEGNPQGEELEVASGDDGDNAAVTNAGLDLAAVEPLRVGKPDLWKKLIGIYLETTPESLASLDTALAEGNLPAIHMAAHTLKSSSANMGAAKLSDLCRQLEAAAGEGNLVVCPDLCGEIRREFELVNAQLAEEGEDISTAERSTA